MNQEKEKHPDVIKALQKLDDTEDVDGLTLEEVMMCRYGLPCRRISPGTDPKFRKYARGSVLIYATEVVIILFPEDNTTRFSHSKDRFVAPRSQYKGVLPFSSIYTNGGHLVHVESDTSAREMREIMKGREEYYEAHPDERNLMFWSNSAGTLNDHRCTEAFGLGGRLAARRHKKAVSGLNWEAMRS